MKKLNVTIQLEMSVPDDWELVGTSEGTPVLKLPNGVFMDVAIEPLFASDPEETWSSTDDDDVLNDILDTAKLDRLALMSPEEVALHTVRALAKNKAIIVPGRRNRWLAFSPRLSPRWLTRKIAGAINKAYCPR